MYFSNVNNLTALNRVTFLLLRLKSYLIQLNLVIFFLLWEIFFSSAFCIIFVFCIVAHLFCFIHLLWILYFSSAFNCLALNSLYCAEVPFRNCSRIHVNYLNTHAWDDLFSWLIRVTCWRILFQKLAQVSWKYPWFLVQVFFFFSFTSFLHWTECSSVVAFTVSN